VRKIYESGSFITPYNSTTTISFKTNSSSEYSGEFDINLNPVIISTQSTQLGVGITLNAYGHGVSTNTTTVSMVQLQKPILSLVLIRDVISKETREFAFSVPFMSSISEIGQIFDKESVLSADSKIALIIQLWENDNE